MWSFYKVSNCWISASWLSVDCPMIHDGANVECFYLRQKKRCFSFGFFTAFLRRFLTWNSVGVSRKVRVGCREAAAGSEEAIWATTSWACRLMPQPLASRPPEPPLRAAEWQRPEPWPSHHTCEHSWKCERLNRHLGLSPEVCGGGWVRLCDWVVFTTTYGTDTRDGNNLHVCDVIRQQSGVWKTPSYIITA